MTAGGRARRRLLVALILEGPIADEVNGLRRALGKGEPDGLAPHLTLVPPLNVAEADLDGGLRHVADTAARHRPFDLELGPTGSFGPDRAVLYLAVREEVHLRALHDDLARGVLQPPVERASRPFVAHVTLARVAGEDLGVLQAGLRHYRAAVAVERVSVLEQIEEAGRHWRLLADYPLGRDVVGRGGVELDLSVKTVLAPAERAWFEANWSAYRRSAYGPQDRPDRPIAIVADHDGATVGIALAEIRGTVCSCERLVVDPARRGEGIGRQLMRHLERVARDAGCHRLRLLTRAVGPAHGFYEAMGYARVADLPEWRDDEDFVVLARSLPTKRPEA